MSCCQQPAELTIERGDKMRTSEAASGNRMSRRTQLVQIWAHRVAGLLALCSGGPQGHVRGSPAPIWPPTSRARE